MKYRDLGKTGMKISEVSFGSWAIGGTWGQVEDETSLKALESAIDEGVNFFDTADVYGDGRSERLLAQLSKNTKSQIYIATKAGRRLNPHVAQGYQLSNIRQFVERSLLNLDVERLDLLQLHCPPSSVYENAEFFESLKELITEGKVAHLGVSVEKTSEAIKAMEYEHIETIQIIYNLFRMKPEDEVFPLAKKNNVGIIVRVPLASGMLTGKMTKDTAFAKDDHRLFNRNGESFDKGETFSGVPYDLALEAVEELKKIMPTKMTLAQFALKWILMNEAVSCVIPGAKNPSQAQQNAAASGFDALSFEVMEKAKAIYEQYLKAEIHPQW